MPACAGEQQGTHGDLAGKISCNEISSGKAALLPCAGMRHGLLEDERESQHAGTSEQVQESGRQR